MPKSIKIHASAKINLCLDILKKTSSGYHKIQTIFQEIPEIYDEIKIENTKNSDNLSIIYGHKFSSAKSIIQKNKNLAFLALQLLKKTCGKKLNQQIQEKFARIIIKKNIPISSGLGGAASDAAAILKGLNKLWNLKLSQKKLLQLAAKLGKDVPFFIIGGTALGTNYGEKITILPRIKNLKFKIFNESAKKNYNLNTNSVPGRSTSKTRSAYIALNIKLCGKNFAKTKQLIKILKNKKIQSKKQFKKILPKLFHNDFKTLKIYKNLPRNHHLSGSGPSTFTAY